MVAASMKHTLAFLRAKAGLSQRELAELAGTSRGYIARIEGGKERLSSALAEKISASTGVSSDWLLGGDPTAPPVTVAGRPFTKEAFERHCAGTSDENVEDTLRTTFLTALCVLVESFRKARERGDAGLWRFIVTQHGLDLVQRWELQIANPTLTMKFKSGETKSIPMVEWAASESETEKPIVHAGIVDKLVEITLASKPLKKSGSRSRKKKA